MSSSSSSSFGRRRSFGALMNSSKNNSNDSDSDSDSENEEQVWTTTANTKLAEKIAGVPSHTSSQKKCKRASFRLFFGLLFVASAFIGAMLAVALHFSLKSNNSAANKFETNRAERLQYLSDTVQNSLAFHTFADTSNSTYNCDTDSTNVPSYYLPTPYACSSTTPWIGGQWICKSAYCGPGRGYYFTDYPKPYTWPNNVTGALIPEIKQNVTCTNVSVTPTPSNGHYYEVNGTHFFCLNGTLNNGTMNATLANGAESNSTEPFFYCANGTLIYNETVICEGALVSEFDGLECNGKTRIFSEIVPNCTYTNYTVFVTPPPTNLLCNESAVWGSKYTFVSGSPSPPICMIIATPQAILKTTWRPLVDAFTVVQLRNSSTRTQWFDCSTAIAIEVGGVTSGPRARFDQGNLDLGYLGCKIIVPFWTIVIHLDGGTVTAIDWDDECSSCQSVSDGDSCVMGNCGVTFDQCIEMGGPTDCNLKVYVSWTGTDSDGNALLSSNLRLSQFQEFSLSSSWSQATNWAGYNLPSLPADNGVPQGPRST